MKSVLLATVLFCLVASSVVHSQIVPTTVTLTPQYDDVATKLRVFSVHRSLVLFCDVSPVDITSNVQLTWTRDGEDVHKIDALKDRFQILSAEHKFIIDRTREDDHGLYACEYQNTRAIINVVANVASRLPKETQLIEGDSLWIVCRVVGTAPKITWVLPNNTTLTNSTDRIILERENDIDNSALYIASVLMEDRGNYTCIAENQATELPNYEPSLSFGMVRIRSKIAPLWPVVGILVQCFVLFVVLFIYEKFFHEKDDLDDEDDYQPPKNPKYKSK